MPIESRSIIRGGNLYRSKVKIHGLHQCIFSQIFQTFVEISGLQYCCKLKFAQLLTTQAQICECELS